MRRFEPAPQSGRESNKSALLTEIGLNDMDVMELGRGDGFPKMLNDSAQGTGTTRS
jgi:hypothetical protein